MIVVIPCGGAKRTTPCKASEMYTGSYHRACLAYARSIARDNNIFILSAKYGLLRLDDEIAPYNARIDGLDAADRAALIARVREQAVTYGIAAVANALIAANDPAFKQLCDRFGRVAIGGMIQGPVLRPVRHLYAAVLTALFPGVQFWLLGQASNVVVNGLARLGLMDRVGADGTWYLHQARCETLPFVNADGLIGMTRLGQGFAQNGQLAVQSLFSLSELMVANIRALAAAYMGLVNWPIPMQLPIDQTDADALAALRESYGFPAQQLSMAI